MAICIQRFSHCSELVIALMPTQTSEREREREIHYIHSASLAYEDGIVFMSEPSAAGQRDNGRQTSGPGAT